MHGIDRKLVQIAAGTQVVNGKVQPVLFGLADDQTIWSLENPLEQGDKVWHVVTESTQLFSGVDDVLTSADDIEVPEGTLRQTSGEVHPN